MENVTQASTGDPVLQQERADGEGHSQWDQCLCGTEICRIQPLSLCRAMTSTGC